MNYNIKHRICSTCESRPSNISPVTGAHCEAQAADFLIKRADPARIAEVHRGPVRTALSGY
jgi:hypothetical protein